MSWLTSVRNALAYVVPVKKETPDNLWHKCKGCGTMTFHKELEDNLHVCPHCDHHDRIGPLLRFQYVFDEHSYTIVPLPKVPDDPLKFRDTKRYVDRIKAARVATSEGDALITARGLIEGRKAVIGVQDFAFMGGSMGLAVGEAFIRGVETAIQENCPYIIFTAAGGARMQEGILSLMQMPKTTVAVRRLKAAGLPYIVLLTDPTTGGVTASYAMLGDIHIAEPGCLIGFAGQRVIQDTIREKLPPGFQRAEYLYQHGMVDMVVPRKNLRAELARLLGYLQPAKAA